MILVLISEQLVTGLLCIYASPSPQAWMKSAVAVRDENAKLVQKYVTGQWVEDAMLSASCRHEGIIFLHA